MVIWSSLFGKGFRASAKKRSPRGTALRRPLRLTVLEDRSLPSGTVWTERGGDGGHTGYVDVAVNAAAITDAWNQPVNYTSSGYWAQNENRAVAIDGSRVYRTELEGYWATGNYHVMAYDLQTGALLWNQTIVGNGPVSAPSVANGLVYINRSGHSGISGGTSADLPYLYALSGQTGSTVLKTSYAAQWASDERPAISGNQLVAWDGYYGGFSAWTASTLTKQWSNPGSIYDAPMAAFDSQYVYAYGNQVYSRANGARQADITHPLGLTLSSPMVSSSGTLLYNVSGTVNGVQKYGIAAYDGVTHALLWTTYTSPAVAGKAVGNGVVAVTSGQQLMLLDEATGAPIRTWQAPANLTSGIVLTRTHAFVETTAFGASTVYAVNLATGQAEWSFQNTLQDETNSTYMDMAFGGGRLLLSHDGFVRAFDMSGGSPPVAVSDSATTAEDAAATVNVLANDTDPDGDTLTVAAVGTPAHGSTSINADGTITYTPAANYNGTDSFTYTISDGHGGTATATVSVTVTPVNDAPVAALWQFGTGEDTPLTSYLRASDVDGDPLTYAIVTPPAHGAVQLDTATGVFTYTPAADFNGTDAFTFKANDGTVDSNVTTIFISVRPVNDAPVARDDGYATSEGTPLVVGPGSGVLLNDTDVDSTALSAVLVSPPTKGTLTLNADGSFTYTPNANTSGTDSFTYKANDGGLDSNVATVTITVNAVQVSPVAVAGPDQITTEGTVVAFDGSGSHDADGDALTYTWSFGDGATATGATPSHGYADNGVYTVTLTVDDGHGNSSSDTLVVAVNNVAPAAGSSGPSTGVRGQSRTFSFTASDASSVDQAGAFTYLINWGDGAAVQSVTGPASISLGHVFTTAGSFTISSTVTDKDGGTSSPASRSVSIKAAEMQGDTLVVGGTTGGDTILIAPSDATGNLVVTINGVREGTFHPTGRVLVYAQAGNDTVQLQSALWKHTTVRVGVPAFLFGGDGNDDLDARGSSANNVLVGGDGGDLLWGGSGRDLLIGGLGADGLHGSGGDDILIGGVTDFDSNLSALTALIGEWSRTDLGYQARIDHLTGVTPGGWNSPYRLTSATVHDDAAVDQMYGEGNQDWFLFSATDVLKDKKNTERATQI